ncbi:MAG TPA: hypothetical protein VKU41_29300 [Polyangiaceae bacterium]|nr:hypothetical protein [Polyangiaceae bacterium]
MSPRAVGLCAVAWLIACKGGASHSVGEAPTADPLASVESAEVTPVDHLAPGELLEGTEHAFGIPLPRDLRIEAAFSDVVYARGGAAVHHVVHYFRQRVEDGTLREEETTAAFDHVKVRGKPGAEFAIRVLGSLTEGTRVEIRDITPVALPALPDDAARWRRAGFTPNGKVADPTHLD